MKNNAILINAIYLYLVMFVFGSSDINAQEEKVFAEHKFVLQISDTDPSKQTMVLNVANNIMKHYGPDNVEVEIVAFGPGLRLLFEGNSHTDRIQGLVTGSGVRFSACENTIITMSKILGHELALNSNATVVSAGVVRLKELADLGYFLVKP